MKTAKKLHSERESFEAVKGLLETYEEMAASRMQQIRDLILKVREYYANLAKLSAEVGADLTSGLSKPTNQKKALLLLSSNEGLTGDIFDKVIIEFLQTARSSSSPVDLFVSGKLGERMLQTLAPELKFTSISGSDKQVDSELLKTVISCLTDYSELTIFYGEFKSLASQLAQKRIVSVGDFLAQIKLQSQAVQVQKLKYLYEPSLSVISKKFSEEIFAGIFSQTVREGQLAQSASRLVSLDAAIVRIDKKKLKIIQSEKRLVRSLAGKKQYFQTTLLASMRKRKNTYVS